MLLTFDEVLPRTVGIVEQSRIVNYLASVTVIRDLRGAVRLALEFPTDLDRAAGGEIRASLSALRAELANGLGPYWGDQIWRMGRRDRPSRALDEVIRNERREWLAPPDTRVIWYKIERVFSKSSWLRSAEPPWRLEDRNPAIISFYSYKGGVGRTLALAAVAVLMARAGHSVAVLDLDLEAPGVGSLLLGDAMPEAGIVDYILERPLTGTPGRIDLILVLQNDPQLIGSGRPIRVFPAGRLTPTYLEKIARLDYEGFASDPSNPLVELLNDIRRQYDDLEFILLDVRAGLHDLGGFSLNGLSHLNILFGLDTDPSWNGFSMVLPLIGRERRGERPELFLVHAMVTPSRFDPQANERFRQRAFDLLQQTYYDIEEDVPDLRDPEAPYGIPIFYRDELLNVKRIHDVLPLITDTEGDYVRLAKLIGTYLGRETL